MQGRTGAGMALHAMPPPWSPWRGRTRTDPARPTRTRGRDDVPLTLIKAAHTLAWFSIESCMAYVLYAGAARRTGRGAALTGAVVAGESLIFAANGFRCPLTLLAEKIGAADGSVTDIWLPRWFRSQPSRHPRSPPGRGRVPERPQPPRPAAPHAANPRRESGAG